MFITPLVKTTHSIAYTINLRGNKLKDVNMKKCQRIT